MSTGRVPRDYLPDDQLARARASLLVHLTGLGQLQHRFEEDGYDGAAELIRADYDAVSAVLGLLVHEQRRRGHDDREAAAS